MKQTVLLSCLLLLAACGKNSNPTPAASFADYTGRDAKNVVTSPVDTTDWTLDRTWNSTEAGLFGKYNITYPQQTVPASTWQFSLYPNPVAIGGTSTLQVLKDKNSPAIPSSLRLACALVDTNYNEVDWSNSTGLNQQFGVRFEYDKTKYSPNTLYRLYYVVYDEITLQAYYKGHGDIQLAP